jgi:D-alanyl-D-alanine carboxypeptidase
MRNYKSFLGYVALLSFFGAVGFVFGALQEPQRFVSETEQLAGAAAALKTPSAFAGIEVTASAAYVFDIESGTVMFDKNSEAQLPLASLTKVALALLAYENLAEDGVVTFSPGSLAPEGDSGFEVGESWIVRDLIDFTVMTSSNDGAAALAEAIERTTNTDIVTLLNALAESLGLSQTYFVNETGLDSSTLFSGAYGSAQDMAALFSYVSTTAPGILAATTIPERTFTSVNGKTYEATNTNRAIADLPGLVLGKTGFTDLAGGNLAVVTEPEPGHAFAVVVLSSTPDGRFADVVTLVRATLRKPAK